jgi:uncharacterized protein
MFMSHEPVSEHSSHLKSLIGKTIDSIEFARNGGELVGHIAVAELARLQDLAVANAGALDVTVAGDLDEQRRPWLHLVVRGELGLVCQRCLGVVSHTLEIETHLRLILTGEPWPEEEFDEGSEGQADEAIAADEMLALSSLVEDEIILSLPYAPMHEACELPGEGELNRKASPFAALAVLKKH